MFADLLDKNIQPQNIDIRHIPDIEISEGLKNRKSKRQSNHNKEQ